MIARQRLLKGKLNITKENLPMGTGTKSVT